MRKNEHSQKGERMAGKPKKETRLSLKIDAQLLADFQAWTKQQGTNVSAALRQYMRTTVDADREKRLRLAELEQRVKSSE